MANHSMVLAAYEKFNSLRVSEYPDMNYFGLNFLNGKISSVKFYFSIYRRINAGDVEAFLPTADDFMKYYHLWESSKVRTGSHTGCAFSVKFKGDEEPEVGFHYRLIENSESFRLVGQPKTLPFSIDELGTRPGINYEYGPRGRVIRRRYYYLERQVHKDYVAQRFCWPFASSCRLCELTEFGDRAKVIFWTPDYIKKYLDRPDPFDENARSVISRLNNEYGLVNAMDGFYEENGTVSSYFFNTIGPKTGNINEGKRNFHMDTLKLFLK